MAMQPTLWSVSALAVEFEMDRRTVAKRLSGVTPSGERQGKPVWRMADAAAAIVGASRDGAEQGDEAELLAERTRKTREEADAIEMKNAQMRGELLLREDVTAAVVSAFARVRARMIGLPPKLAPMMVTISEIAEAEALIRRAVYDALRELADTSVADLCGDDGDVVACSGAASGPDGKPVG